MSQNKLYLGDCLNILTTLEDSSIDMVFYNQVLPTKGLQLFVDFVNKLSG